MQNAFEQLRQQAADRRDQQVQLARKEYNETCRTIDQLERTFKKGVVRKTGARRPLASFVIECIGDGKPFTIAELKATIDKRYPSRQPCYDSVKQMTYKLLRAGKVRRVGFNGKGNSVYAIRS